jgi:hypothetical protein
MGSGRSPFSIDCHCEQSTNRQTTSDVVRREIHFLCCTQTVFDPTMPDDEDDDLYDDVEDKKLAPKPPSDSKAPPASSERPLSLTAEVQVLKHRVQKVDQENTNLKRNMGTLYRTAAAELKRKDAQIATLQTQLEQAQLQVHAKNNQQL